MISINIFDRNFNPSPSVSKCGPNNYINWVFLNNTYIPNSTDIIIYTDKYLKYSKDHIIKRKIAWLVEPPSIDKNIYNYIKNNYSDFDFVLTFDKSLIKKIENSLYLPNIMTFIQECDRKIWEKTKLVSLIFSNKTKCDNHIFRRDVVKCMTDNNFNIDMFGKLVDNYIMEKIDGLKNYMFHIVVENCNIDGYYSEKVLDCFLTGTIPIVYDNEINDEFDKNGIIKFKSIDELKVIMKLLNKELFESKSENIKNNFNIEIKYTVAEAYLYYKYNYILLN